MEISVKIYNLEDISEEYHRVGNNLEEIISLFSTTSYAILNDLKTEYVDDTKIIADEIKGLLDEGFIAVKKHEKYIFNACKEYEETDTYLSDEVVLLANKIYQSSTTYSASVVAPNSEIFPSVNPNVTPLLKPDLPKTNVDRLDIEEKRSGGIITKLKEAIVSGSDKYDDMFRAMLGVVGLIVSSGILSGLSDLLPYDRLYEGLIELNDGDGNNGNLSGNSENQYDKFLELVGNAFQTNYALIEALAYEFILLSIINSSMFIGEMDKYATLSDISYSNSMVSNNTEYEEDDVSKKKEKDKTKENKIENSYEDSIYDSVSSGFAAGLSAGYTRDEDDDFVTIKPGTINTIEEADEIVAKDAKDLEFESVLDSDAASSSSGISGGSSISGGGLGSSASYGSGGSIGATSSFVSDADEDGFILSGSTTEDQSVKGKTNFKAEYSKADNFYERILSANASNIGKGFSLRGMGAISSGIAALSGIGGIGALSGSGTAEDLLSSNNKKSAISTIIGAMDYSNIFDYVGNAKLCNLDWLSEVISVLL